nr:immunoglobulin heavy chain junction region [Mus musculus]NSM03936.1 immunoglobulin heavy chain junction region [Mus musculus]NSM03939.1 immunoglobulin heavy chain junction region [Mus musculus]NSM04012.1 immunoglobulin heavy chain junction region [Mus musculus]NSM04055.1 immunoglobulin heavy chain junction region [Mus musculus]
CTVFRYAMDYW